MSKLINADRLKKDILALQDCYNGFSETYDKACIIGVIDEQPTIELNKGKWKEHKDYPNLAFLCSECGYFTTMRSHFCPSCGADMRGGEAE